MSEEQMKEGWIEYKRFIISEIEQINKSLQELEKNQHDSDLKVNTLQVKMGIISGFIGLIAGAVPKLIDVIMSKL